MNKLEQIKQGFEYTRSILNSLTISGIDNCKKVSIIYNNIEILLTMIANGEITVVDNTEEKSSTKKKWF